MPLTAVENARNLFIRRWGEMGASWGISRTMAELHALLYLSNEPLCTDDVMAQLSISRGNASMNLRELVNWGLIHRVHRRGDRKEYFEAEKDVWQMFETIIRERRRREVLPIVETIERCRSIVEAEKKTLPATLRRTAEEDQKRYADILEFCEVMNSIFNLVSRVGKTGVRPLAKALGKLAG
ncbi:MAG: ArsR family transcriptional regulator [Planctomycetes bacterium]|nr:ArsR family transcriptional regulator [Planctomycetota bacterium]